MTAMHDVSKRAAVLALLATGTSIRKAAKECGVGVATVSRWRDENPPPVPLASPDMAVIPASDGTVFREDGTQKRRREIGEQLYDYMQTSVETLTAQLRLFGDRDWLAKQPAGELGTLHGIVADKTARLLAAYQRGIESSDEQAE
jgi:hypothetical protein